MPSFLYRRQNNNITLQKNHLCSGECRAFSTISFFCISVEKIKWKFIVFYFSSKMYKDIFQILNIGLVYSFILWRAFSLFHFTINFWLRFDQEYASTSPAHACSTSKWSIFELSFTTTARSKNKNYINETKKQVFSFVQFHLLQ